MSNGATAGGGIGLGTLCFLATIVFVILKLVGTIAWSWWLVFLPLIAYGGLIVVILFAMLVVTVIAIFIAAMFSK